MNIQLKKNDNIDPRLYGFGGWLYLLAIGLIGSSIFQILKIPEYIEIMNSSQYNEYSSIKPQWAVYYWLTLSYSITILGLLIMIAYSTYKQRRTFSKLIIIFYSLIFLFSIVCFYFDTILYGAGNSLQIITSAIYLLIWSAYILRSKRVKLTFYR